MCIGHIRPRLIEHVFELLVGPLHYKHRVHDAVGLPELPRGHLRLHRVGHLLELRGRHYIGIVRCLLLELFCGHLYKLLFSGK